MADEHNENISPLTIQCQGDIMRATGRRYHDLMKAVESMPAVAVNDLIRLIRDLKDETQTEKNKRRRGMFWG